MEKREEIQTHSNKFLKFLRENQNELKFYYRVTFVLICLIIFYFIASPIQNCKRDYFATACYGDSRIATERFKW